MLKQEPTNSEAWWGLDRIKAGYVLINRVLYNYREPTNTLTHILGSREADIMAIRDETKAKMTKSDIILSNAHSRITKIFKELKNE
jgi:hypothetical protein